MLVKSVSELKDLLRNAKEQENKIGFVPTMGALHDGHISLVNQANSENNLVVVSIFVNPTQFNNQEDLKLYPRTLEKDLELLQGFENCIIFCPTISEIYPDNEQFNSIDLGKLDKVLEGKFRPGHFQGVVHVVHNLFKIVMPDNAYFGLKDFQQLAVIRFMNKQYEFPIQIFGCETLRDKTGLALSSRNMRLSDEEREDALILWKTLNYIKENKTAYSPIELKKQAINFFNQGKLELEYLEIVTAETLEIASDWSTENVCCIAAYCGKVRLIDNLLL
jgi:pantoate--beta-alanine ligase